MSNARRPTGTITTSQRKVILILLLVYVVNYADRMIIGVVGESIKRDLGLSDGQLGMLSGTSFTILYVLSSFPAGRLVERFSRVRIIWMAIAIWATGTVLCGAAQNFGQLLLARAAVGMGEGAFIPAVLSLLSDYFPPRRRASAYSMVVFGLPFGGVLGAFVGSWMTAHYGWQSAFVAVGLPGLILAAFVARALHEPVRGGSDPDVARAAGLPTIGQVLSSLVRNRTFLHLAFAGGLIQIVSYAIALFLFPFLTRTYGLSYVSAGAIVGIVNGLSTAIGILGGGLLVDRLAKRGARWYALAPGIAMLVALPLYVLALAWTKSWLLSVVLLFIPATIVPAFSPTIAMTIQSLVDPRMRGTTAAISSALAHVVSLGLGVAAAGFASDYFASRAFVSGGGRGDYASQCLHGGHAAIAALCGAASATGLRLGLIAVSVFLIWASFHLFLAARTIEHRFGKAAAD